MKIIYLFILTVFALNTAYSQWSTNPFENLEIASHGGNIHVVPDENGGAVITFNNFDYETVTTYLQWVDKYGYLKWNEPKIIADTPGPINYAQNIFLNNDGSVLIGYISGYDSIAAPMIYRKYNAYVHKIDSSGNKLWGEYGISVKRDTTGRNLDVVYCDDGDGGIFAFWIITYDLNYPPYSLDSLFIQHISKDGERLWGDTGIFIADSIEFSAPVWHIVGDNNSGFILNYGQGLIEKYNSNGILQWSVSDKNYWELIRDGQGGIIGSWVKTISPRQLRINRISSVGEKLWGEDGVLVDDSIDNNYSYSAKLFLNDDQMVSIFWDTEWWPNDDLFLQRYTLEGEQVWEEHLKVSAYATNKTRLGIIESDNNSNLIVWSENRDTTGNYAQKIDVTGIKLWNADKYIGAGTAGFNVITDGNSGAIAVWQKDPPWGGIYAQQISKNGNLGEIITSVIKDDNTKPLNFYLAQNYPNPFNPSTKIKFALPKQENIKLDIFNLLGEKVKTLVNDFYNSGLYEVDFDASNLSGGIYFYRLKAGNFTDIKKMILLR